MCYEFRARARPIGLTFGANLSFRALSKVKARQQCTREHPAALRGAVRTLKSPFPISRVGSRFGVDMNRGGPFATRVSQEPLVETNSRRARA